MAFAVTKDSLPRCSYFVCAILEAVLIPTPFYGVIAEDLQLYSDVALYHVPLDCEVGAVRVCVGEGGCTSLHIRLFSSAESFLEPSLSLGVSFGRRLTFFPCH